MKIIRWVWLPLILAAVATASLIPQKAVPPDDIMQVKLIHAHRILDALVLEKFEEAARSADRLAQLSREAAWKRRTTPRYEHYSSEFYRLSTELARAARDRDYDAAAQSYLEVSMTCFDCHKHVRGVKMASVKDQLNPLR